MEQEFAIEINNLNKEINNRAIIKNINVKFEKGKIYGIVGRNGSGKSMFFKSICGLTNRDSGEIKFFKKSLLNGDFPRDTGIIIENPGFLPQYSAFKNLKILASINNNVTDERINECIDLVGLSSSDKRPVRKYSLGMKQKLGIAQALMEYPKILILDEPMNGLDSESVDMVRNLLLGLKKQGVTIVLASHNTEDIDSLCDEVYKIDGGELKKC